MWLGDTLPTNHPWLAMGQEYNEKKILSTHHPSCMVPWLVLLWVIFLRKRARREPQEGRQIRPFLFSKILEVHGRRRHQLNGGTAGGDQSEPAPTSTPCRMNGMWRGNTFPL